MKRRDLEKQVRDLGCVFLRHGGRHDWWHNPATKASQPIPRHNEINEHLARHILKKLAHKP